MLRVCLPGGHKRLCESDGRVMRKACSVETGGCFSFDVAAIAGWVARMARLQAELRVTFIVAGFSEMPA